MGVNPPAGGRNHVILTLGRSGSSTLVDMMNQHPAVLNCGELLGEWNTLRKLQRRLGLFRGGDADYLDAVLDDPRVLGAINFGRNLNKLRKRRPGERKRFSGLQSVGFKEFDLNLRRYGLNGWLARRCNGQGLRVIGLTRTNTLARLISSDLLRETGVVARQAGEARQERPRLVLDPQTIVARLDQVGVENAELVQTLSALPQGSVLWLDYDDLYSSVERTADAMRRVFDFLGVPPHPVQTRMTRLGTRDPLAAVANADDIAPVLRDSPYARFLET